MPNRVPPQNSFGDEALHLCAPDSHLLVKVDHLVDWATLDTYGSYSYGKVGKPSANLLARFKILLEQWHSLSNPQRADRLSFRRFLGLSLTNTIPDEAVLVRFRIQPIKGRMADTAIIQSARKTPPKGVLGSEVAGDFAAGRALKNGKPVAFSHKAHMLSMKGA